MGEILIKYYKYMSDQLGSQGKIELAKLTKVPSTIAATVPDTPDKIKLFKDSIEKITKKPAPNL